jgi:hypothetical protein
MHRTIHENAAPPSQVVMSTPFFDPLKFTDDVAKLMNYGRSYTDTHFEFLWHKQANMQTFAQTAGGRTTCLRSLSKRYE